MSPHTRRMQSRESKERRFRHGNPCRTVRINRQSSAVVLEPGTTTTDPVFVVFPLPGVTSLKELFPGIV